MSVKQSRSLSFLFLCFVYLLSLIVGVFVFRVLPFSLFWNLLLADVAATVTVFLFSLICSNASVYDPYWSVLPPVLLGFLSLQTGVTPFGWLLLTAVFFWGIRLTANWAYTFHGLQYQDWRYTMLKEQTGGFYPVVNFFGIHLVPTLIVFGCIFPAVYALQDRLPLSGRSIPFLLLSVGAVIFQGVADVQMHRFRKKKTIGFLETGLWKYSRHPNYLGEILMWWGIALSVFAVSPGNPAILSGALANTLLFLIVSIPMADRRQARKEGFDAYRSRTRMLLPIPKKAQHSKRTGF